MKNKYWTVYIIETYSGKFYTGITTDLKRRFNEHKSQKKGAKFFNIDGAKKIVYQEILKNRSESSKRESEIKRMSRKEKILLMRNTKIDTEAMAFKGEAL